MQPFVKWAGGKRQIIDKLLQYKPKKFNTYFEPFVGGGALLLELAPKHAVINDSNKDLICLYKCLRNKNLYDKLAALCKEHENNHSEEYFYFIRDLDKNTKKFSKMSVPFKASRCLYLNRACFNGLYRVNSKGFFNVPSGKYKTIKCFNDDNMISIYKYFHKNKPIILNKDFELAVKNAKSGDFVYFDPPYDIINNQSFTNYTKNGFGRDEQTRLRDCIIKLTEKGVFVMTSNANTDFIKKLYKDFNIHFVKARRMINSKADSRGAVEELIITNY